MEETELQKKREALVTRFGFTPVPVRDDEKVGISRNVLTGLMPINGVRARPERGTTGWYIWAGEEMSSDPNFFEPLHVSHLATWAPSILAYLTLPPGWRFLVAPSYEDVWFDEEVDLRSVDEAEP